MPKTAYNKSALSKQRENLALYERLLPSLDLKKQQLSATLRKAVGEERDALAAVGEHRKETGRRLPMLANPEIVVEGLVTVEAVDLEDENVVGVTLPRLKGVQTETAPYSFLAKPHWVDRYVKRQDEMIELLAGARVARLRLDLLAAAVKRITQRVNLFEKVLIPEARENIRRIQIFLADAERAAVVRSKICKARHVRRRAEEAGAEPEPAVGS